MGVFFSLRGGLFLALALYCGIRTFRRPVFGVAFFLAMVLLRDAYLRVFFPAATAFHFPQIFALLTLLAIFLQPKNDKAHEVYVSGVMWLLFFYVIAVNISAYFSPPVTSHQGDKASVELIKSALFFTMILYSCRTSRHSIFPFPQCLLRLSN